MMTPTAESWPRESFLIRRLIGRRNSATNRSAKLWSQCGKNIAAIRRAWVAFASSG